MKCQETVSLCSTSRLFATENGKVHAVHGFLAKKGSFVLQKKLWLEAEANSSLFQKLF
jgi:hypothetical protein